MKKIIGLTGPIGSGKSTVTKILKKMGASVIDADNVSRKVVAKNQPALKKLIRKFGNSIIREDGTLDRKTLGKIVFGDQEKRQDLNRILHPYILEEIDKEVLRFLDDLEGEILVIDAALLFETGLHEKVDTVWYVDAREAIRISRILERDAITYEDAMRRIEAQPGQDKNRQQADIIIKNEDGLEQLMHQVETLYTNTISLKGRFFD